MTIPPISNEPEPAPSWEDELSKRGIEAARHLLAMAPFGPNSTIPLFLDTKYNPNTYQVRTWLAQAERAEKVRNDTEAAEQKARDKDVARWTKTAARYAVVAAVVSIVTLIVTVAAWLHPSN